VTTDSDRDLGDRVVIVGNSGSGKTTLAKRLARRNGAPVTDLDRIHWQDSVLVRRDEQAAIAMVAELAAQPRWIIEGVYGWLAAAALPRATSLIWLDLPWSICRVGLEQRGRWNGATDAEHAAFLQWAEAYWQRSTPTSYAGHLAMFEAFAGDKLRIQSRDGIAALAAQQDDRANDV
jgi:adenylate kinase family enzyme